MVWKLPCKPTTALSLLHSYRPEASTPHTASTFQLNVGLLLVLCCLCSLQCKQARCKLCKHWMLCCHIPTTVNTGFTMRAGLRSKVTDTVSLTYHFPATTARGQADNTSASTCKLPASYGLAPCRPYGGLDHGRLDSSIMLLASLPVTRSPPCCISILQLEPSGH
jgi:hypothetical protein